MATKWEDTGWEDDKCGNRMAALQQNWSNAGRGCISEDDECLLEADATDTVAG